ncbi:MAG: hypothetical protein NW223_24190 [Hyphomicrobiaceae bacterium]|nr:hypothetical protein [Hyphomicrobiaceae bacterium]
MNYIATEFLAALPEIRTAVRPLVGPYARLALVQVLAESVVDGASFEAETDPDARLRRAVEQLEAIVADLKATPQPSRLTNLMLSRKYAALLQSE